MNVHLKAILILLVSIVGCFIAASLLDIIVAAIYSRYYSRALFVVIFGVAGIFAGVFGWSYQLEKKEKQPVHTWILPLAMILLGLLFIFFLAPLEGGEYESAFFSFGLMLGLTGIFTWWHRKDR